MDNYMSSDILFTQRTKKKKKNLNRGVVTTFWYKGVS